MKVEVNTDTLKAGGNAAGRYCSDCEAPYSGAVSISSGNCTSLDSFKGALKEKFNTFSEHSNIVEVTLNECAACLEEVDNIIGGCITSALPSVDNLDFDNAFSTDIEGNSLEGIDDIIRDGRYSPNLLPKNNSLIAHRGYHPGGIWENTAEAFEAAGKQGFWGCETDVRFDSKGNLVCSHNTVQNGQNPTSFSEYLKICKKYGMTAIIDLKYVNGTGEDETNLSSTILKTIQEQGMMDSCVLQTNNPSDIKTIRQTSSSARIWYLESGKSATSAEMMKIIKDNNVEGVNIKNGQYTSQKIKALEEAGVDVCTWNVQSESTKNSLLDAGSTYVMSDNSLGVTPYQEGEEDFNNLNNNSI